jgi:pheromone shutdown-related protein TraB
VSVTELVSGGTTYHVIGTAHVSQRSVDEVRAAIAEIHPEVVCVELDRRRYDALIRGSAFHDLDVSRAIREGRTLYLLAQIVLTAYQRRIGARLGVKPGAELLAAIEAAQAAGIPIELIDRDIDITFQRTWRNLGSWTRIALFASLIIALRGTGARGKPVSVQEIEDLKQPKVLSDMLTELGRVVPEIKGPLIDERDQYLASRLAEVGRGRRTVVAVVGAAHVPGIEAHLGVPIDRAPLEQIPPPSAVWRAIRWLVPIAFVGALIYGWQWSDAGFTDIMLAWILPTSIGAGGATLATGGSLASVLSAIAIAPLAAIHPRLGTGMVVGVVEARHRRPSLADRERLPGDTETLRGFWRNPVTRILLIALASRIGAAVGFWIGVVRVAGRL